MAKPPLPLLQLDPKAPLWIQNVWPNVLLDWQFAVATAAARVACRVYQSVVQSITNAAWNTLLFDSEDYDIGRLHSTTANTSRLTVPTAGNGIYIVTGEVGFANNNVGLRYMGFLKNGATRFVQSDANTVNGDATFLNGTQTFSLVAGDYLELQCFQTSGGALNDSAGINGTSFSIVRVF